MTSTTAIQPGGRTRTTLNRIGIVLSALLGAGDIATGASQLGGGVIPAVVCIGLLVLGVLTLVAAVFAWRGAAWGTWAIVVTRAISAITALPAFFTPDVPAASVFVAAIGIAVTVLAIVLVLVKPARR